MDQSDNEYQDNTAELDGSVNLLSPGEVKAKKELSNKKSIAAMVAARVDEEQTRLGTSLPENLPPGAPLDVSSAFTYQCLCANELGDGMLFAAMHRKNFIYNITSESWLKWGGNFWAPDELMEVLSAVEDVVDRYHDAASTLADITIGEAADEKGSKSVNLRKQYLKKADRLRTVPGRARCLKFAAHNRAGLVVQASIFDLNPMLLACANGVIDLKSGRHRPGRQEEFITRASSVNWQGIDAPAPRFKAALHEIFQNNEGIIGYVQRLFGYGITGLIDEHIFPVFQGRGRNGKSMLLDIVKEAVGALAAPIRPELLLDQGIGRSSAAPSPDIMALRGLRLAMAEETDEGARFSASRVKWLTGGTELTGRNPHDKYDTTFNPTHLLFLCTNNRPKAPAADFAFWARMRLIKFETSFVDNPVHEHERQVDKKLPQLIIQNELPGVLAWLVQGCLAWQKQGLRPPLEVLTATKDYRQEEDMAGDFIDECLTLDPTGSANSTEIYQLFVGWYKTTQGRQPPSQGWLGRQLSSRYDRRKSHGVYRYYGIGINYDSSRQYSEINT